MDYKDKGEENLKCWRVEIFELHVLSGEGPKLVIDWLAGKLKTLLINKFRKLNLLYPFFSRSIFKMEKATISKEVSNSWSPIKIPDSGWKKREFRRPP